MESFNLIKYKYEMGVYTLKQMCEFVEKNYISKDEFHWITDYNYDGIKESGIR